MKLMEYSRSIKVLLAFLLTIQQNCSQPPEHPSKLVPYLLKDEVIVSSAYKAHIFIVMTLFSKIEEIDIEKCL